MSQKQPQQQSQSQSLQLRLHLQNNQPRPKSLDELKCLGDVEKIGGKGDRITMNCSRRMWSREESRIDANVALLMSHSIDAANGYDDYYSSSIISAIFNAPTTTTTKITTKLIDEIMKYSNLRIISTYIDRYRIRLKFDSIIDATRFISIIRNYLYNININININLNKYFKYRKNQRNANKLNRTNEEEEEEEEAEAEAVETEDLNGRRRRKNDSSCPIKRDTISKYRRNIIDYISYRGIEDDYNFNNRRCRGRLRSMVFARRLHWQLILRLRAIFDSLVGRLIQIILIRFLLLLNCIQNIEQFRWNVHSRFTIRNLKRFLASELKIRYDFNSIRKMERFLMPIEPCYEGDLERIRLRQPAKSADTEKTTSIRNITANNNEIKRRDNDDDDDDDLNLMMTVTTATSTAKNQSKIATIKNRRASQPTPPSTPPSAPASVPASASVAASGTVIEPIRALEGSTVGWRQSSYAYTFLLLLTTMTIHSGCHNHFASAAKPKSATQLQRNHQHHQQPQQGQIAYGAGDDNLEFGSDGILLTPPPSYQMVSLRSSNGETAMDMDLEEDDGIFYSSSQFDEQLFDEEKVAVTGNAFNAIDYIDDPSNQTSDDNSTLIVKAPLFPTDLFTKEQLERGAVVCHILGVIYMFVALAIVCDEFFVPSLDVIIEKLGITDDVAGATFMAAGGSAPELFTSVIGVFVSFDDVGIGTIVGSAVFNILFVIGMCALFSRTVLSLTWWPLFRDCTFYSISLMVLIYFFRDNLIYWWEALILFGVYIAYVTFMKWNVQVESCVKRLITKNKVTRVRSTDQLMPAGNAANSSETSMATQPGGSVTSRAASETRSGPPGSSSGCGPGGPGSSGPGTTGNSSGGNASSTQTGAKFRHGLLQLMIHTIDPLHDDDVPGKVDEKATQLHAIASLKVLLDATKPQRGGATTSAANHVKINLKETALADRPNGNIDTTLDSPQIEIEDEPEPLSMAWPDTARKRLTYILVAPLLIPMWLTLPDTRTPKGKRFFPVTFIGSILWIAAFSYLMVWWANVAGDTARIPPEVMGLTFLAAGTSIPDLITSVIVARKGFGDMAVSSSVGSNIFDVTVGLPIPWLLYGIFYDAPVEVNSVGMVCSITILFMMLIFVVMSIACFHWRMNKGLGFTMFLLYFVFVAVSLMFEYDVITCPV